MEQHSGSPLILLVEDTLIIQRAQKSNLESLGYRVDIAENGRSALEKFNDQYQLVLLDLGLPDIFGIDVCKTIRAEYPNLKTPIIALTAFGEEIKQRCLLAGMQDFLMKPVSQEKLGFLLAKWIGN